MITLEELQKFCAQDENYPYLRQPFNIGCHTFATNKVIMVRVKKVKGVKIKQSDEVNKGVLGYAALLDEPLNLAPLCLKTRWRRVIPKQTQIGVHWFDSKYIDMLNKLPNIKVSETHPESTPMAFRFDGGEGLLMPMRKE